MKNEAKKGVAGKIAGKPLAFIILVVLITAVFSYFYVTTGTSMVAEEETYMPENDIVQANTRVMQEFGTTYSVTILVKSSGNVLSKSVFTDMLDVEAKIQNDTFISQYLSDVYMGHSILSVADIFVNYLLIRDIANNASAFFDSISALYAQMNNTLESLAQMVQWAKTQGDINTTIVVVNESLAAVATGLAAANKTAANSFKMRTVSAKESIGIIKNLSAEEFNQNLSDFFTNTSFAMAVNISWHFALAAMEKCRETVGELFAALQELEADNTIAQNYTAYIALVSSLYTLSEMNKSLALGHESLLQINGAAMANKITMGVEKSRNMATQMLSADFSASNIRAKAAIITVTLNYTRLPGESDKERDDRFLRVERKIAALCESGHNTRFTVIGSQLVSDEIIKASNESLNTLLVIAFIIVLLILLAIYRSPLDMCVSLLGIFFAIIWVWGTGIVLNFTFNPVTIVVPVIVVALGIDYGIHITMRFREETKRGAEPRTAAMLTMASVGVALLLATVTTIAAFLSNISSDIKVLREFGMLCAFGIFYSFIIMNLFVIPAKIYIEKRKKRLSAKKLGRAARVFNTKKSVFVGLKGINRALASSSVIAERHPAAVVAVSLLITLPALWAGLNVDKRFDIKDFLPEDVEIAKETKYLIDNFNLREDTAYILVDGNVATAEFMEAMARVIDNLNASKFVVKDALGNAKLDCILTVMHDLIDDNRINDPFDLYSESFASLFNSADIDGDGVPERNITMLYDYMLGNATLRTVVSYYLHKNTNYDSAVIRVVVSASDALVPAMAKSLESGASPLSNAGLKFIVTGGSIVKHIILDSITNTMKKSMIITFLAALAAICTAFLIINRTIVVGIIAMIPISLDLVWISATMYVLDIPFNVLTISVLALTIGLGVDYAIHFAHRFVEDYRKLGNSMKAGINAARHTGTALFGSMTTTVAGFGILVFSILPPVRQLGIIIALTVVYAFIATVFIMPVGLILWAKKTKNQQKQTKA